MSDTYQHGVGYIISPIFQTIVVSLNLNTTKSLQPQEQLSRFSLNEDLGIERTPPIFAANGIQFIYNYRKQSPTIFTLSLGNEPSTLHLYSQLLYEFITLIFYVNHFVFSKLSCPITITHIPGPGGGSITRLTYYFKAISNYLIYFTIIY